MSPFRGLIERLAKLEHTAVPDVAPRAPAPGVQPLSILHVSLSHDFGGTERYCLDLMERQLARGHHVSLVRWHPASGRKCGVPAEKLPGLNIYWARKNFARFAIERAIGEQKIDIINTHLGDSARAAKLVSPRPPTVLTMHLRYHKNQAKGLDGLVLIADWQREEVRGFQGLTTVAYNWPPSNPAKQSIDPLERRKQIGVGPDDIVVGYMGRLAPVKCVDILISAFKEAAVPGTHLIIIGDGPERAKLETLAGDSGNIRFLGHQSETDSWLHAMDLFALSSHWEGMPLSVLEAMRAGTAILATASDGTAEVLRGTRATQVPPRDIPAMRDAFKQLLIDRNALKRGPYDMTRYDPDRSVVVIEDFYRKVIAAKR